MSGFLDKMKQSKGTWLLVIGVIAGLLLVFVGNGEESTATPVEDLTASGFSETDDYITTLELRVSRLLEAMDGVSGVSVILLPDITGETVYAQNGRYEGGTMTEREYVFTDKDGKPMVVRLVYPKLRGIAVVCRGGSNPITQEKIISLLCALFDLSSGKVYVTG